MSATKAEIFIPEAQLPTYRAASTADVSPLTERDFRRRAAAYRNSYYRAYQQATLRGFPDKHLQFDLLVYIQTDAYTPPKKYKDILRMVKADLKALLQDPLPAAPREALRRSLFNLWPHWQPPPHLLCMALAPLLSLPATGIGFRCPS